MPGLTFDESPEDPSTHIARYGFLAAEELELGWLSSKLLEFARPSLGIPPHAKTTLETWYACGRPGVPAGTASIEEQISILQKTDEELHQSFEHVTDRYAAGRILEARRLATREPLTGGSVFYRALIRLVSTSDDMLRRAPIDEEAASYVARGVLQARARAGITLSSRGPEQTDTGATEPVEEGYGDPVERGRETFYRESSASSDAS